MFEVGTKVIDLDGFEGVVREVVTHGGSVWFSVQFRGGRAARHAGELKVAA